MLPSQLYHTRKAPTLRKLSTSTANTQSLRRNPLAHNTMPTPSLTSTPYKLWVQKLQLGVGLGLPPPMQWKPQTSPYWAQNVKVRLLILRTPFSLRKNTGPWRMKQKLWGNSWLIIWDWRWLLGSTAGNNECFKLELSGAWEPPNS